MSSAEGLGHGTKSASRYHVLRDARRKWSLYLFLLPTFALLVTFKYYPVLSAFWLSAFEWNGGVGFTFVGLGNFQRLAADRVFAQSVITALKLAAFDVAVVITMPLLMAELLHNLRNKRVQYYYRIAVVVPMVVPSLVTLLIWAFIYNPSVGLLNELLHTVGAGSLARPWLGESATALYAVMGVGFPWVGAVSTLIYLAGLQAIPDSIFDAGRIDGVTALRRFWYIDLPLLMGQVKLLVMLAVIGGIQGFQNVLILTNGGPGYATMVPGLYMYQNAFTYNRLGYGTAIGVVMFIIMLSLTVLNNRYIRSSVEYEAT